MRLEKSEKELDYPETVKIVKIEKDKFEETKKGIKFDESVINLFKGIKEVKKGKTDKISYTSQEHYYYELTKIDQTLKLKDVCKYITIELKKKLNISEKELETLKSSHPFTHDDYELIVSTISSDNYKKYQSLQNDKKTKDSKKNSPVKTKSVITMKLNNIQEIQDSDDEDEDSEDEVKETKSKKSKKFKEVKEEKEEDEESEDEVKSKKETKSKKSKEVKEDEKESEEDEDEELSEIDE